MVKRRWLRHVDLKQYSLKRCQTKTCCRPIRQTHVKGTMTEWLKQTKTSGTIRNTEQENTIWAQWTKTKHVLLWKVCLYLCFFMMYTQQMLGYQFGKNSINDYLNKATYLCYSLTMGCKLCFLRTFPFSQGNTPGITTNW